MNNLKQFAELAKRCNTGSEFYNKARQIKGISEELSEWFYRNYNPNEMLSPEKASMDFFEDVQQGKYDHIINKSYIN